MTKDQIKIDMPVTYWKVIKRDGSKHDPVRTVIQSEPWMLGHGEWVCRVANFSGGISISHLEPIQP